MDSIAHALSPQSLVMTIDKCFYCLSKDDVKCLELTHCFGIKACPKCYDKAIRDMNAFMHREGLVPMTHDRLKQFTELLSGKFPVQRSSGLVELGWFLDMGRHFFYDTATDAWLVPVTQGNLTKCVSIHEFLKDDIAVNLPRGSNEIIENAIRVLKAGVYLADSDLHDSVVNIDAPLTVADIPNIEYACVEGVIGRILNVP